MARTVTLVTLLGALALLSACETNFGPEQIIYPWQGIKFDPQSHQNVFARGILVQIQGQQYVSVWPFESAAKEVVWPLRPWGTK